MNERCIYLALAVLTAITFVAIFPILETAIGIVLLLVMMGYSYMAMRTGLPLLIKCGEYCSR